MANENMEGIMEVPDDGVCQDQDQELNRVQERLGMLNTGHNPLEIYNDSHFQTIYHFSKASVNEMINIFNLKTLPELHNNNFVTFSPLHQLLITLRFYVSGNFHDASNHFMGIGVKTLKTVIRRVSEKIAVTSKDFIHQPQNSDELVASLNRFYQLYHFPNVLGAINSTQIKITQITKDAMFYQNCKGWYSINTQIVSNADMKFTNIIARWPGAVHQNKIFNTCRLRRDIESGQYAQSVLLGDNRYICQTYLLTPLPNANLANEKAYNKAHQKTKKVVDKAIKLWKTRFPSLILGIPLKPERAVDVIVATAVLHNFAIIRNEAMPNMSDDDDFEEVICWKPDPDRDEDDENDAHRATLINAVFNL